VNTFQYLRPDSLEELFAMMATHGSNARLLAGGTDLLVRMRKGSSLARAVIDLKRITALRSDVTRTASGIRIGARTVMTDIINDPVVQRYFSALREAALVVGSVQIRNRATLSGNLCNASPAADTAPALLAYGAQINLISASGARQVALDQFFSGPGRTTLANGEIVESIDLVLPASDTGAAFERLTRQHGVDLAIVSVCCVVSRSSARFGLGAVGPRPLLVDDESGILSGDRTDSARRDAALRQLLAAASPISDLRARDDYRSAMLHVLARRALNAATERMRGARGTA
jgi:CO/xanthine dehydrogenase FAD-binding subunit